MKTSGVYAILNKNSGKLYIGSSKDIESRINHHFTCLKASRHRNRYLQRSYNFNQEDYTWFLVEECKREDRFSREQYWIDYYSVANLYNSNPYVDRPPDTTGMKMSEEFRKKCSERSKTSFLGKHHTQKTKERLSRLRKQFYIDNPDRRKESILPSSAILRSAELRRGKPALNRAPLVGTNGTETKEFASVKEAAEYLNASQGNISANATCADISLCKTKSVKGWVFVTLERKDEIEQRFHDFCTAKRKRT